MLFTIEHFVFSDLMLKKNIIFAPLPPQYLRPWLNEKSPEALTNLLKLSRLNQI